MVQRSVFARILDKKKRELFNKDKLKSPKDFSTEVQVVGGIKSLPSLRPLAGLSGRPATWGLRQGPNLLKAAVWNLGQWEKS